MSRSPSASPAVRVVITGIGMVTPLGWGREQSWQALCAGRSATRWLPELELATCAPMGTSVEIGAHHAQSGAARRPAARSVTLAIGAPALLPEPESLSETNTPSHSPDLLAAFRSQHLDPVVAYAALAAEEAVADARLDFSAAGNPRIGCVVGTSKGGLRSFARFRSLVHSSAAGNHGPDEHAAALWQQVAPAAPAQFLAARYKLGGAALCPVAACATGLISLSTGVDLIQRGYCDSVLAGSSDASLQEILLASYRRLGVLAHGVDDPATACRPFDRTRTGFVPGEGAAILVLEREECARARGVVPYAEWLSGDTASDPAHLTRMDSDPHSLAWLIRKVVATARLSPSNLGYINLHGTGTRSNDLCETQAVRSALGHAAAGSIACSSLKGAIGHLLGGAGSVELAATVLALRDGVIPPTLNLREADPQCDLDYTPLSARRTSAETALKLSLGFGGHCVAAVIRRGDRPAEYIAT